MGYFLGEYTGESAVFSFIVEEKTPRKKETEEEKYSGCGSQKKEKKEKRMQSSSIHDNHVHRFRVSRRTVGPWATLKPPPRGEAATSSEHG